MIEKNVKLDMSIDICPMLITVQQWEKNARKLKIALTSGGQPFDISGYSRVQLQYDKPDGTSVIEDTGGDYLAVQNNEIHLTFSEQMCSADGTAVGKLMLFDGDDSVIATTLFKVHIENGLINEEKIISSDEYNALLKLYAEVKKLEQEVIEAEKERTTNETVRQTNEADRLNAEASRKHAETIREGSETIRKSNEEQRTADEILRQQAEDSRVFAETERKETFEHLQDTFHEELTKIENIDVSPIMEDDSYRLCVTDKDGITATSPNLLNKLGIGDVETGEYAENVSASITGAFGNQKLNLRIPVGQNGKSAYQIAVDNGFEGSESAWLASLKGEKGDKGDANDNVSVATKAIQDGNGNVIADTYLPLSGGTITGELILTKGSYVHAAQGQAGVKGYVNIATFTVTRSYINRPIMMEITRRGLSESTRISIGFNNSSSVLCGVSYFSYTGAAISAYIHNTSDNIWDLYIEKSESYDIIVVQNLYIGTGSNSDPNVPILEWKNIAVTSVPDGAKAIVLGGNVKTAENATGDGDGNVITDTYLPLSGGIMSGAIKVGTGLEVIKPSGVGSSGLSLAIGNTSPSFTTMNIQGYSNVIFSLGIPGGSVYCSSSSAYLGTGTNKWGAVYASTGTIQTSDRHEKNSIESLDENLTLDFISSLKPVRYKFNNNTSNRYHWGLISQDIEETMSDLGMDSKDFAGFIKSPKTIINENGEEEIIEGEYNYSLRYDEFIAPIIVVVQDHKDKIAYLEETVKSQNERIETLEHMVQQSLVR